ncbi:MAG: NEW3 domain-containing protein [Planctomycetota bacterium]|nr:NEW3 domain-containing protein [Planctomycetota bacterium]
MSSQEEGHKYRSGSLSSDVQYIEEAGKEIIEESNFVPAPLLDERDFARRELKDIFVASNINRKDSLNFGVGRRGGRGDLVKTAGETFQLPVNVYNFSDADAQVQVRLDLPGGLEDKTGPKNCRPKPASAQTLTFTIHIPFNRQPGLGKIRALAATDGKQLDPFTTDILVRSPLEVLPLESAPKPGAAVRARFTNASLAPVDAELRLDLPSSWRTRESTRKLSKVPPGQTAEASFTITHARPQPFHRYPVTAVAKIGEQQAELQTRLDFVAVQPIEHPVILDGNLDEWFASGPLDCGQRGNDYIYNQLSQILDPTNFSARIRTLYDRDHLYLALDVRDDEICEEDTKHGLLWDLDSVQVSFDVDGDGKMDERLNLSPTGRSYMLPTDPRSDREPMITGSKGMAEIAARVFFEPTASRTRGSIIELAIPWAWFQKKQFQPKPGAKLGVHIFCVDEDVRSWSARPWKFDEGRKNVFVPFVLGEPVDGVKPSDWSPRPGLLRKVFSRAPGDVSATKVGPEAGLVFGPYIAGQSERFPTTGLDLANRAKAQRLWFYGTGLIEYEYDFSGWKPTKEIEAIEFAAELSTCYRPGNTHYALPGNPTRLQVKIGNLSIGSVDLLGDPGVDGWLIRLRVTDTGTFHRNKRISHVRLDSLFKELHGKVRVRLTAAGLSGSPGGLNVHGPNGSGVHGIDPSLVIISKR